MKLMLNDTSVQMLLALLRASLHELEPEQNFFQGVSPDDWKKCYKLAVRHGVMALAWDSVMKLPKDLQPPRPVKLPWASAVEAYEQKYNRYCTMVDEVSRFYAAHGIRTVQLKGVGFSTLYPVPSHREGGDIDIYTYSADPSRMSDKEANDLANELMKEQGIKVDVEHSEKHSNFYYKGIPFENHRSLVDVGWYSVAPQIERILQKSIRPELVPLEVGEVLVPSSEFNSLFIAFHAAQHYGNGLALHHLCDWAIILCRYGLHLPEEIKDERLLNGIAAMTRLCNQYLGTNQPVQGGEVLAEEMMDEILQPKYAQELPTCNKIGILVFKLRRMLHAHKLQSQILYRPLTHRIWRAIVTKISDPSTIFGGKFHESTKKNK